MVNESFSNLLRLHHIGISVPKLNELYDESQLIKDLDQGVYLRFETLGNLTIELLQPIDENSFIYEAAKKSNKLLHICYEVPNLEEALGEAKQQGFRVLRKPVSAVAFPNMQIAWTFHAIFGLVEFLG